MTDAQFLSNNFVIYAANQVICKTLMQDSWAYKIPNNCRNRRNRWKGSPLRSDSLPKSWNFCHFFGPRSTPVNQLAWSSVWPSAKRTHGPHAKFYMNWCSESPLRGESADFLPVSKNNTSSFFPLCGILPVTTDTHRPELASGKVTAQNSTERIGAIQIRLIHGLPCLRCHVGRLSQAPSIPKSITELKMLQVISDSLPQEPINKVVKSFTVRLKRYAEAGGEQLEHIDWLSNIRQIARCVASVTLFCCVSAQTFFQRAKQSLGGHAKISIISSYLKIIKCLLKFQPVAEKTANNRNITFLPHLECYQTGRASCPGYSSALGLGPPKVASDRR